MGMFPRCSDRYDYKWSLSREEEKLIRDHREKEDERMRDAKAMLMSQISCIIYEVADLLNGETAKLLALNMWQSKEFIEYVLKIIKENE